MRKKKKRNAFDRLVLLLLLAVAVIPISHLFRARSAPKEESVTLTLRLCHVLPEIAEAAAAADTVSLDGIFSLRVERAERTAATLTLHTPEGAPVKCRSRLYEDVTLTLTGTGTFSEDGFLLAGRRPLSAGMTLSLSARDLSLNALLLSIRQEETDIHP